MQFSKLTSENVAQVVDVILSQKKYAKIVDAISLDRTKSQILINTSNIMSPLIVANGTYQVFGAFSKDKELVGVLFTVASSQQVSYYLTRAHVKRGVDNSKDILAGLLSYTVKSYESAGYQRFSTLYQESALVSIPRLWDFNKVLPNYKSYTELKLEANAKPKQTEIWEVLYGRTLSPEPTVVRTFILQT